MRDAEDDGGFGFRFNANGEERTRIIANPEADSSCGATGLLGGEDLDVAAGVGGAGDDGGGGLCFNANEEKCPRITANPETNPWHAH